MTFKTLVKRFEENGATLEYRMGDNGRGYYVDGNFVTNSRETIEEILIRMKVIDMYKVGGKLQ